MIPFSTFYSSSLKQTLIFWFEGFVYFYVACNILGTFLGGCSLIDDFELLLINAPYFLSCL